MSVQQSISQDIPATSAPRRNRATGVFLVLLLSAIGIGIGLVIFLYGAQATSESSAFIRSPEFITWMFVNEVIFALYPLSTVLLWKALPQFKQYLVRNKMELLIASTIAFVFYMLPNVIGRFVAKPRPSPYEYVQIRIPTLEVVAFLAGALPFTLGIWLVQIALRETFKEIEGSKNQIEAYVRLRDYLQQSLLGLGVLLSIGILASAALRQAAIATKTTAAADYPQIYLLIIGAYYTLVIALLYFPAYVALAATGKRLLETCFPLPEPHDETWAKAYEDRKSFEDFLELKVSGEQRFLTNLTVLAPFVGSIFTLLVGQ